MYCAIFRSIVCSSASSSERSGQSRLEPLLDWVCCRICNSDVLRCTPDSTLRRNREPTSVPSSCTQVVSMSPPVASMPATSMPLVTRNALTCGHSCPGAKLTTAQFSPPKLWSLTASSCEPAVSGSGRGVFPVIGTATFSVTSGIGNICWIASLERPSGTSISAISTASR